MCPVRISAAGRAAPVHEERAEVPASRRDLGKVHGPLHPSISDSDLPAGDPLSTVEYGPGAGRRGIARLRVGGPERNGGAKRIAARMDQDGGRAVDFSGRPELADIVPGAPKRGPGAFKGTGGRVAAGRREVKGRHGRRNNPSRARASWRSQNLHCLVATSAQRHPMFYP